MRFSDRLEPYRILDGEYASPPRVPWGAFHVPGPCGMKLLVIASDGDDITVPDEFRGWEHVSVSTNRRIPNWTEMCFIKDLFWSDEECVVQFHPPKSEYVNNYSKCLHLWRYAKADFPLPPNILVGVQKLGELE